MIKINVQASSNYDISIERGLISRCGELIKEVAKNAEKVFVVTDDNVSSHYLKPVLESLQKSGYKTFSAILRAGESAKSIKNFELLSANAIDAGLTRNDVFVALGGGVIGDLTGFVSACFMRGVGYIQIPTTLLASIDSSVGGKTAVNLEEGKNLVGAFHQPLAVLFDASTLKTLPHEEILCGLGEAIKYAVLDGGRIYELLAKDGLNDDNVEELVKLCVESKAKTVQKDEFEHGERKLLNLGHTVGHAVEKLSEFKQPHGIAVMKGIAKICNAEVKNGLLASEEADKILQMAEKYGFDLSIDYTAKQLAETAVSDKKVSGKGEITLILVEAIGKCYTKNEKLENIEEFLK